MNKLTETKMERLGLDKVVMEDVKDEINEEMRNNKTSFRSGLNMPTAANLKMDNDGTVNLKLVFVSLHSHATISLRLLKADIYLEKLASYIHLAHTLQNRQDVLRQIAHEVMRVLDLKVAPIHFFDKNG